MMGLNEQVQSFGATNGSINVVSFSPKLPEFPASGTFDPPGLFDAGCLSTVLFPFDQVPLTSRTFEALPQQNKTK